MLMIFSNGEKLGIYVAIAAACVFSYINIVVFLRIMKNNPSVVTYLVVGYCMASILILWPFTLTVGTYAAITQEAQIDFLIIYSAIGSKMLLHSRLPAHESSFIDRQPFVDHRLFLVHEYISIAAPARTD